MANGIETVSRLLTLTLGPSTGRILVEDRRAGEFLDDAELITQRLLELPNAFEDMGNQLIRKALASVGNKCHDGLATCAVIADSILRNVEPLLVSGHDSRQLMLDVATATRHVFDMIDQWSETVETCEDLKAILLTAMVDDEIAAIVADIVSTVGPYRSIKVEEWRLRDLAHEFVHGSRWTTRPASPYFLPSGTTVHSVPDPIIAVSSDPLTRVDALIPVVQAAAERRRGLALIAPSFTDQVISLLLMNRERGVLKDAIAITAPESIHFRNEILDDIASIAGATRPSLRHRKELLQARDMGSATELWYSMFAFGIVGGNGDHQSIDARLESVRCQASEESNFARRERLDERVGTLEGLSALIRVPDRTAAFGQNSVHKVNKALAIARGAIQSGVVPGGGSTLARCAIELERVHATTLGSQVLCHALRAPMTALLANAGCSPGPVLHQMAQQEQSQVFDVRNQEWRNSRESGLQDAVISTKVALETAASVALMVISTGTLVSRKAIGQDFRLDI